MDQNPESSQSQPLSDLERRRIESEIARNEAECKKFIVETEEIRKRIPKKYYLFWQIIKTAFKIIIAAGLLAIWVISYYEPMRQTKQINAELNNAKLAKENWTQTQVNEQQRLENEMQKKINEQQRQENERITNENRKKQAQLDAATDTLRSIYDFLTNKLKLSAKKPASIDDLLKSMEQRFSVLDQTIVQLRLKTIYFDSTSFELRQDAKASLNENIRVLKEFPDTKIRIEANGDGFFWNTTMEHMFPRSTYQKYSSRDSVLADKRVRKVMDYLIDQGISANRITAISYVGYLESARRSCRFVVVKQ
jgi:outer membrane protein OmpA-like peptidoglycan-associated protein